MSPTRKCIFTHLCDTESLAFVCFVCCILCILHVLLTLFSMFLLTARGIRYQASATRTQIHRLIYPSPSRPPDLIKHRYKCTLKHPPLHLDSGEVFRWAEMSYSTGMQWPTEDLGTLCVHLIRTSGMSVASGPLPSFLQLSSVGSWIYFTVPWCYRVLASHQPSPKRLLTMSAAELSQRNSCQL